MDDAPWQQQLQHRVRRQVSNETSDRSDVSTSLPDSMVARDDKDARFYDEADYYNDVYIDEDAYDDYRFYARELTHYNKVRHFSQISYHRPIIGIVVTRKGLLTTVAEPVNVV